VDGDLLKFLTQFRNAPRSVGAIVPSSRELAEAMIAPIDFKAARVIVEFGPGTGVMTGAILKKLGPDTQYVGVEINETFCQTLTLRFPELQFFNRGAQDIKEILASLGLQSVDAIVCGLPWASLPIELQNRIMAAIVEVLKPGGIFVTFAYLQGLVLPAAGMLRRRLKAQFAVVKTTKIVWRNVPPAFAYVCYR
jgi:phosphatidylethanolamine/phosphatidyl-N-methylethanolamine N-methyltransferase